MNIEETKIISSYDSSFQPIKYYRATGENRPLLTALHTWGYDYTQDISSEYFARCEERDWNCIFPNFRGVNNKPEACASEAAKQDVIDTVQWAADEFHVDPRRFFLAGASGGGFMALNLAANFPTRWTAVSSWVPISDLARWYHETTSLGLTYADDLVKVCGGTPGQSKEIDNEYRKRSPIENLWRAHIIPMDINAGIHDGHPNTGSVPVGHSIRAFNELAKASGDKNGIIGEELIEYIEQTQSVPDIYPSADKTDELYPAGIHLRQISSLARLTIFEGGHEILYDSAFGWFDKF